MLHFLNCQVFCYTNDKNNEEKNLHNQSGYAPETREWTIWGFQPPKWLCKASHIEDCGPTRQLFNVSFMVKGPVLNKTDSGENSWEKGQVRTNMALWVIENDSGCIFVMHSVVHRAGILGMHKVVHRAGIPVMHNVVLTDFSPALPTCLRLQQVLWDPSVKVGYSHLIFSNQSLDMDSWDPINQVKIFNSQKLIHLLQLGCSYWVLQKQTYGENSKSACYYSFLHTS